MSWSSGTIRIIVGTDFHGSKKAFESFARNIREYDVDLAALCGDVTNFGTVEQAKSLLEMLAGMGIPVIFVPGNCDPPSLADIRLNSLTCIHGGAIVRGNLAFIGLGGSVTTPFNTFFEMREEEMERILRGCMENLRRLEEQPSIVLISHTPPKNTRLDKTFMGIHAGSVAVRRFIEVNKPLLALCGHIHEARGIDRIDKTVIVNPGPAKQGNYALVTIKGIEVDVELRREEV